MPGFKWIVNMNLQRKITLLLVLFILIPLLLFGLLYYRSSNQFVMDRTDQETDQVVQLVQQNVDQLLSKYEEQLKSIYEDEDAILQLSEMNRSRSEQPSAADAFNRFLRNYLRGKDDVDSIYLYSNHNVYFADFKGSSYFTAQFDKHPEWQQAVDQAAGKAVWLPTFKLEPNRYNMQSTYYFSVGMQLKNVADTMQKIGTVYMNVKISALDHLIQNVNVSPNGILMLADTDGHVLWHRNTAAYDTSLQELPFYKELLAQKERHMTVQLDNQSFRVSYVPSAYNHWLYLSFIPQSDLNEQSKELRRFFYLTLIAFGGSFILLAFLISRFITRPIRQIALAMKQIHKENVDVKLPAAADDEVGMLQASFNSMRRRINELIQEVRVVSEKEKEAEVRALQAQINPHFVYNSLDTINWVAIDREQDDISGMITALSDIMRYAIRPGEPWIILEEELKWARNYAYLQKIRFEDRFEVVIEASEELLLWKVPRLYLQPYLENAILHGMEHIEEGGIISVTIQPDEKTGGIRTVLKDNGGGIPEHELREITMRRARGIGIYNLDDRLKLEFGPEYGVDICSDIHDGTVVTIILPKVNKQETEASRHEL
jgi:Predicted signal transduction protein with a C-terminal ATPase domain